tara:strand:- start:9127 stop:10545 length:1419 start_codon:yes stop_codon:yes gene_type:complete
MKKRLFPLLITLSALAVSASAAFYSVFGLSKLFAGATNEVIIMAGSLEFAKLVVASLLYQYWSTINKWLRSYLMLACFVLMVITSGGIYGFLSGAYQSTATQSELLDKSLMILNQKQVRFEETKEDLTLEKTQINKSISDLRVSLSNPSSVSYWDENSQTVITTTSSSARRALQSELKTTIVDRDDINLKIEAVMDSINKTDMALLDKEISNEAESELGPLKYLSETTGQPMNKVVNWFLLLIIFVFDPLAIALVVAANMAFAQLKKPEDTKEDYFKKRNEHMVKVVMSTPEEQVNSPSFRSEHMKKWATDDVEEFDPLDPLSINYPKFAKESIFTNKNKSLEQEEFDKIPEEIKNKEDELMIEAETEKYTEDEKRMDVIGQNGNDGLHYEKELYLESQNDIDLNKIDDYLKTIDYVEKKEDSPHNLKNEKELIEELSKLSESINTSVLDKEESEKKSRVLRYDKTKRKKDI